MIDPEPAAPTDGVEFGVAVESGVALVYAWVVGSVIDGSVVVKGSSVVGKPKLMIF